METPENTLSISQKRKAEKTKKLQSRRTDYDFLRQSNILYSKLLSVKKAKNGEERVSKVSVHAGVEQMLNHLGDRIAKLHERDQACISRSVQACLKYGNKAQRKKIILRTMSIYKELSCSKYGHKLAMKIYLYSDKLLRNRIVKTLTKKRSIFFSKFGAIVWEYAYSLDLGPKLQREMLYRICVPNEILIKIGEIGGGSPFDEVLGRIENKDSLAAYMRNVLQKCIDKELLDKVPVHSALRFFCSCCNDADKTDMMDRISEGAVQIASTKDGSQALCILLGYATAKHRKAFVKSIKSKVFDFCTNSVTYVIIMRLLATVDDTKLLSDIIIKELCVEDSLRQLCFHKFGHKVLLHILCPGSTRYFSEAERKLIGSPSPTSLKAPEVRRAALLQMLLKPLCSLVFVDSCISEEKRKREVVKRLVKLPRFITEAEKVKLRNPDSTVEQIVPERNIGENSERREVRFDDWLSDNSCKSIIVELLTNCNDSNLFPVLIEKIVSSISQQMLEGTPQDWSLCSASSHRTLIQLLKTGSVASLQLAIELCKMILGFANTNLPKYQQLLRTRAVFVFATIIVVLKNGVKNRSAGSGNPTDVEVSLLDKINNKAFVKKTEETLLGYEKEFPDKKEGPQRLREAIKLNA